MIYSNNNDIIAEVLNICTVQSFIVRTIYHTTFITKSYSKIIASILIVAQKKNRCIFILQQNNKFTRTKIYRKFLIDLHHIYPTGPGT